MGNKIDQLDVKNEGYAIEVRINAERVVEKNGTVDFVPTPGTIEQCSLPQYDHIELISMAAPGKTVSPFYDSMIAQIICYGKDRKEATEKLVDYLNEVVITGVCTNISLAKTILTDPDFINGNYDTNYLPNLLARIDIAKLIEETETSSDFGGNQIDSQQLKIEGSDELKVLSPSTSIFYGSSSPSEPPFVHEGDTITIDQTLCLMEAMKIFTPLTLRQFNGRDNKIYHPEQKFKVTRVMNSDGQQVNQGDLLFVVKPIETVESVA